MNFNSQKDNIRKRLIEEAPLKTVKIQKIIQRIDNIPKEKLTKDLKETKQRLSVLLKEYLNTVDFYQNQFSEVEAPEEEIVEDNLVDNVLTRKNVSHTEILVLETEEDYVKVKLISSLNLMDKHEFTLKITNENGILNISDYDLPNFIPETLDLAIKTGEFESINALIKIIVEYLESYLIRRENVLALKKKFLPDMVKELEYCTAFCHIAFTLVIRATQSDNTTEILLHYPYKSSIADSVNLTIPDAAINKSWFKNMKNEVAIFKAYPLYEAFCRFGNISDDISE